MRQPVDTTDGALMERAMEELDLPHVLDDIAKYCMTSMAGDVVRALRPRTDADDLRDDLDRVQECVDIIASGVPFPFERVSDIRPLVTKAIIEGNFLSATELLHVQEAMSVSRTTRRFIGERPAAERLRAFVESLIDNRVLEKHITDAIDDTGTVRDNASRELQAIRKEIHELSARLRSRLQRILKKFGEDEILQDEFITQRDGRFVLPLRVGDKRSVPGIIHGVSQSGSTVFMEPAETFDMNNELSLLHARENREIIKILTTLTAELAAVAPDVRAAFDVLLQLDSILARARYAVDLGGIKPIIADDEDVELRNVHHPVLKSQVRREKQSRSRDDDNEVIPLSVDFREATRGILISGPNAGGKTVAMKTIGLSMAMAMCGVFPLGMCRTGIRRIFTAIGDHQSIESNLSTFSSQIIRIRDILSHCGRDAMVLIDEICAGTDPAEGGALAAGILDSLLERGACFVITTHQSSLKQYALTRPAIENASLAFDEAQMQPTFRFLPGVPGNSYAFVLAHNVGLPDVVVQRARGYLGERHDELEQSITAMQRFRQEAEDLRMKSAEEHQKAERLRKDYEERLAQVKQKRSTVVEDAREEAREVLRKAQALVENTIREVREQQKSAAEIKKAFSAEASELSNALADDASDSSHGSQTPYSGVSHYGGTHGASHASSHASSDSAAIKTGDTVVVDGTNAIGTVISIDTKSASAMVEVNGIKFKFQLSKLSTTTSKPKPMPERDMGVMLKMDSHTNLDLRGKRADEGLRELEMFINDAVLGNLTHVSIIHGKGTGAMRRVVQDYLKEHPQIKTSRLGTIQEGGDGVTIIELA
ncbi:MAG: endonuclease MutS2 [bacterium]|nr:endonuclease MutS2 [bacterium]